MPEVAVSKMACCSSVARRRASAAARSFGDVFGDTDGAFGRGRRVDQAGGHPGPEATAVLAPGQHLARHGTALEDAREVLLDCFGIFLVTAEPDANRLAHLFVFCVTEHFVEAPVATNDVQVAQQNDAGRGGIEQRLLLLVGTAQRLGRFALDGDVLDGADQALGEVGAVDGLRGHAAPEETAVLPEQLSILAVIAVLRQVGSDLAADLRKRGLVGIPAARSLADHLARPVAEDPLHRSVAAQDLAVAHEHDAGRRRVVDRLLLFIGEAQGFGGRPFGSDVFQHADDALAEFGRIDGGGRQPHPEGAVVLAPRKMFA